MEYYGNSSAMPRYLGSAVDPPPTDWNSQHVATDLGMEEAMRQMNLQSHDGAERGLFGPFPERPGEIDCAHYMRTGICGFGMTCRFNHPPRRNIAAAVARNRGEYPERPGDPECQHFVKTGTCKFGATCKYHHPKYKAGTSDWQQLNALGYPLRLNEKECSHYVKTGQCKFGVTCKYHHPQPVGPSVAIAGPSYYPTGASLSIPSPQQYAGGLTTWPISRTPLMANPYLQGPSTYVPFVIPHGMMPVPGWNSFHGQVGSITSRDVGQQAPGTGLFYGPRYQTDGMNPSIQGALASYSSRSGSMGIPSTNTQMEHMFPERHGQPECQFYMRTGYCKYGSTCKYHHPRDRTVPLTSCTLSPLGLPLRSGAQTCSFYVRQGFCKYGPTCKYDHPMGTLSYSPSASSLADMPVAPYPVGSAPATLAPSFSSTELRTETTAGPFKESILTPETPLSSSAGESLDLGAQGPLLSTSTGLTSSESEENPLVKKSNQVSVLPNGIAKEGDIPISN